MDPWLGGSLILALLLLLGIAGLSGVETAVLNARRSRLGEGPRAEGAAAILESPEQFQTSAHLAKSLCESVLYAAAALAGLGVAVQGRWEPAPLGDTLATAWPGVVVGALLGYLTVTLLGEAIPKALAARQPEEMLMRSAAFIRAFTLAFTPMLWLTRTLGRFLAATAGADAAITSRAAHSEEEIKLLVEDSAEEGVLEEDEKEMIHSIFEFTDTVARQIMTHRTDVHSVSVDCPLADVVALAVDTGHSRFPVYENTLDTVVGVVHVKDLLPHLLPRRAGAPRKSIRELTRPPYFVPEGKKIDELLQEFRRQKSQLAIVVDEYGGTSGLVTVEDVLEEIVGEIEDEYDTEERTDEVVPTENGALVDARMPLDDFNERFETELSTEENDTVGGFVFSLFGRPPEVGERVTHEHLEFVVEELDGLRLSRLRILAAAAAEEAGEE
jgi:putative hemolysin